MEEEREEIYTRLTTYGEEEEFGGGVGGGVGGGGVRVQRVYGGDSWYVTIRLSDFKGADIVEIEGEEEGMEKRRGIFIPFREGGLTVTSKKKVLAVFRADVAQVASERYTHLLRQIVDQDVAMEWREKGYTPGYNGHMRRAIKKKQQLI